MRAHHLAALILTAAALTSCGTVPVADSPAVAAPTTVQSAVIPAPTAVTVPAIGAESTLIPLGLNADRSLQVPPDTQPEQAGWFERGVIPGQPGPAVIAGHVSGRPEGVDASIPGVFARLAELGPGDEIIVDRYDAEPLTFVVFAVEQYAKDQYPTAAVYGDVAGTELRLITCGGAFDRAARSYDDNIVVYARIADGSP